MVVLHSMRTSSITPLGRITVWPKQGGGSKLGHLRSFAGRAHSFHDLPYEEVRRVSVTIIEKSKA